MPGDGVLGLWEFEAVAVGAASLEQSSTLDPRCCLTSMLRFVPVRRRLCLCEDALTHCRAFAVCVTSAPALPFSLSSSSLPPTQRPFFTSTTFHTVCR